ncbi:hypothetical protein CEUSTIGMA_g2976.t1 [Chlamydomonas eustigma]|uniref:Eukaryotic translation initiation factor 2A n=1 Tax=Chlamydomonas eustigma TaxID=1157962 RepID=A0A250WXG6_9CHLO|nr:hypothetical protein CEUSTIGMA_g2976.t1 [Chlamydomonas eustigma]|eukprot:GAX75533.1 hypothetical protein CEUSTIGMA_g2976.t1 [Chlamydomonas eustigma]
MSTPNLIARHPEDIAFYSHGISDKLLSIPGHNFLASSDGSLLVIITATAVDVYDGHGTTKITSIPEPSVILTSLSPNKGYLVTCTKPKKDEQGQPGTNLKVWSLPDGTAVQAVPQKQVSKDHWPAIHWAGDDSAFAHCVTNTAHIYGKEDGFSSYRKLMIKGVTGLSLSPAASGPALTKLAAFIPESKGAPASAGVYDWSGSGHSEPQPVVRKSFFRTQGAQMLWNKTGSAVLVLAFTDFDVTNQSYYGEQKLHYLPSDPAKSDKACTVDLKEGPVHDVQWSATGDYFAVVAGFIPSKVMLYDANCKPVYDFGSGPYNTIRWNPFGRFLAVAGFGNLPGDIIFYDKKASGTCKQMGAVRCPAVTAEWSPDGRHLLTATTAPRLRVDNGYKVFTYYGQQVSTQSFPTLYEAAWLPAPPGTFQDRPQSPSRLTASASGSSAGQGPATAAVPAPRAAGYVPPHLRGTGGAAAAAAVKPQFSLAFDSSDKPGRVSSRPQSAKPQVPGAEFVGKPAGGGNSSGGAAKGRVKKADDRSNPTTTGTVGAFSYPPAPCRGGANASPAAKEESDDRTAAGEKQAVPEGSAESAIDVTADAGGASAAGPEEPAKRIRALQKKLRQVTDLKEKLQKEGGKNITPEQQVKLSGEAALVSELAALGVSQQ